MTMALSLTKWQQILAAMFDISDLDKMTVNLVQKALKLMKTGKNDAIFDFNLWIRRSCHP